MRKLNNKGFTLVEVIAVVVLIAVLGMIAVPNILGTINKSKESSYDILVEDIVIASQQLFEEIEYNNSKIKKYDSGGKTNEDISINIDEDSQKYITVNLQTLVSNGLLAGSNNPDEGAGNKKIVVNPKDKKDIGECEIKITKIVDSDYKTSYKILTDDGANGGSCPTEADYNKAIGVEGNGE